MSNIQLFNGDCLEVMKQIPDESVDLILCDLPYGVLGNNPPSKWKTKDDIKQWDKVIDTKKLFEIYAKKLRNCSRIILFSQGEYTAELIKNCYGNNITFCQKAIWLKNKAGNILGCKRQLVNGFEDILIFNKFYEDNTENNDICDILLKNLKENGFTKEDVYKEVGSTASHYFSKGKQCRIPSMEKYKILQDKGLITLDYNILKLKKLKKLSFNMEDDEKMIMNVFRFNKDSSNYHPTQKPTALLEKLINIYSNKGDVILDNCMGSGSTGVACVNTGRDFIGIELDEKYFNIAKDRIDKAVEDKKVDI